MLAQIALNNFTRRNAEKTLNNFIENKFFCQVQYFLRHFSYTMKYLLFFLISFLLFGLYPAAAQENFPVIQSSRGQESKMILNHFAWGVGVAEGTPTYGRNAGEVLFSMLYARTLSPTSELEISFQHLPIQRYQDYGRIVDTTSPYISLSWFGDVTFMFQPFSGFLKGLRIGIGSTITLQSFMATANQGPFRIVRYADSAHTIPIVIAQTPSRDDTQLTTTIGLGANLKLEYLVPLTHNVDISCRAQLHAFRASALLQNTFQNEVSGGLGSIGVFLRVGW